MKLSIRWTHCCIVLGIAFATGSTRAEGTNTLVLDRLYEKYTVPEGKMAIPYLRLVGSQSVESFQKENVLAVDGVVGMKTWERLSDALQKRGVELKPRADAPIGFTITTVDDRHICLELSNRTASDILIQAGDSLYQSGPVRSAFIRISVKFSGEGDGRRFSGVGAIPLELKVPLHIKPHGSVKLLKSYRRIGSGATILTVSTVATQNENKVCLINGGPFLLKESVAFQD